MFTRLRMFTKGQGRNITFQDNSQSQSHSGVYLLRQANQLHIGLDFLALTNLDQGLWLIKNEKRQSAGAKWMYPFSEKRLK